MASKTIKLTVTSNEIVLPIDDAFIGRYVKITITDDIAIPRTPKSKGYGPKILISSERDKNIVTFNLGRKPDENVIDDVPAWSNLFKNPKPETKKEEPKKDESKKDFSDKVTISKKIIIDKFDYEDSDASDSITDRDKELLNSFTFEEDRPNLNSNDILDEAPNWNSGKPFEKDIDIFGTNEAGE